MSVKVLIANGANVDATNSIGYAALMRATLWGYSDITQALLAKGKQNNSRSK